jgi:taurine dioxygenase
MAVRTVGIDPLPTFGATVSGVDCKAIDAELAQQLRDAWQTHRLLIFRDAVHDEDDLVALGATFGDVLVSRQESPLTTRPEIMVITNVRVDGKVAGVLPDGEMQWHFDGLHQTVPYRGSILWALSVPSRGGETRFADMCRAYEALPESMKQRLAGLTARNSYDYAAADVTEKKIAADAPIAVHSVVRDIPETGRKAIFVAKLMTDRINEVDEAESREILTFLYEHMARPEFAYQHHWSVGDAVLWHNHSLAHARTDFDPSEERMLKRVTLR